MAQAIVITSGKGGVGKTTTTANIGAGLAGLGKKVCLIDTDIGLRNLDVVLGMENRIIYDITDVTGKHCQLRQALIKDKYNPNLYLLPAAQTKDKQAVSPEEMVQLCNSLKEEFEYIIIDSPAGIEHGFDNAVAGADDAVIITTPEVSAVRDADRVTGLLEARGLTYPKIIVNRIRPDMSQQGDMMNIEDITDILALDLLGVIPDDQKVIISTNRGEPVVREEKSASGKAFNNISRRLTGEKVPLMDLTNNNGILSKIRNFFSGS